ncbi:MAG: glycine cleavage system aminomethyltransferase GcvT [Phycisphaeraceae bacterium]|nr:glycine cleavage system aminomethyltransferase GcvT [Phycisphaeraceae bacterium]
MTTDASATPAAAAAATSAPLLETPLHDLHVDLGAKMVDFTGWHMPLHYGSIVDEHHQIRQRGGFFDVSHMGRFEFSGRDAARFLERVCTRAIHDMQPGQARYSLVCNEQGGCRDDVLVYRIAEAEFLMVCNAANRAKLIEHFAAVREGMVFRFEDITMRTAMVAVQGPQVMDLIRRHSTEIPSLKRYRFCRKNLLGLEMTISRTGYTGEDGVEIIFPTGNAIARTVLRRGMSELAQLGEAMKPAGLGARDSLRLEASMALYGHEITEDIDPLSACLDFAVTLTKGDGDGAPVRFIGQDALERIRRDGLRRRLVGLELDGRRAARQGMAIIRPGGNDHAGIITSGCLSPTLDRSIAMGFIDVALSEPGTPVSIDLGRRQESARVVTMPFYRAGARA